MERPTVSLDKANAYFANRLRADVWNATQDATREQALAQSSFLIGGAFAFSSNAYAVDENGTVVWNERVDAAICEEAIWLLSQDPAQIPAALFQGVASASAGAVSATFDKSFVIPWIAPVVKTLVGDLGTLVESDDSYVKSTLMAL